MNDGTLLDDLMQVEYREGGDDVARDGGLDCWGLARQVLERMGVCSKDSLVSDRTAIAANLQRAVEVPAGAAAQRGDVILMLLELQQHVAVCLDAFRAIHATSTGGIAIVQIAMLRRMDRQLRILRPLPQDLAIEAPEILGHVPGIAIAVYDDILTRRNRRTTTLSLGDGCRIPVASAIEAVRRYIGLGQHIGKPLLVALNGALIDECDRQTRMVSNGDELVIAPRPADFGVGVMIAIAIASAAASSYFVSRVRHAPTQAESERRFAFGRYSSDAVVGDAVPVIFGTHVRAGGKTIVKVPGEGPDGDTRIKILIDYGRGPIAQIGNQTADFDRVPASELEGIYFNDQAIENFPGVVCSGRMGTADQDVIPGFDDTETLREVGVGGSALENTDDVERTGADASAEAVLYTTLDPVNALVVRVRFSRGLYSVSPSGQTNSRRVQYRYRTRLSAGPGAWSSWTVVTVERADQSEVFSAARADNLNAGVAAGFDVQVERVSVASSSAADVDEMIFDSVQEIQYAENAYPGKALLAIEITASEQLTSPPKVSADLKGYAALRLWDGVSAPDSPAFTAGWSDNPADIALELMTNTEWGAGAAYGDDDIDFTSLLEWRAYCAESIPRVSGGGNRPRFACNLAMREHRRAIDWLRVVCRTGRCVPATTGNVWRFIADRPRTTAVETFSDATIATEGGVALIEYTREISTGGVVRPNRWVAQFNNALREGRDDTIAFPELGEFWLGDPDNEPLREESVRVEGVTDPEQIAAELVYISKRIRGLSRSVSFTTTKQVPQVQPGERFDLASSLPGWGLASGRVLAGCTTTAVKLDRSVTLAADTDYVIRIVHQDGTVEDANVTAAAGDYDAGDEISIEAVSFEPAEFEEYVLGEEDVHVKPFVCTRVSLVDFRRMLWEIAGVEYDEQVYDDTPGDIELPDYSTLRSVVTAPGPLEAIVAEERTLNGVRQVVLSWRQSIADAENTGSFRIYRRMTGTTAWVLLPGATPARRQHVLELADLDRAYQFVVVAVSIGGAALSPYDTRHPIATLVYGLSQPPPPPPEDPVLTNTGGNTYTLSWDEAPGAVGYQVLYGGDAGTGKPNDGAEDCLVLARTVGATSTSLTGLELAPGQPHRFYVRSEGPSGRLSETATTVYLASAAIPAGETIKQTRVLALSSEGTTANTTWNGGASRLELTNAAAPGSWTSPEITPGGGVTLTELTLRPATANDADDPALNTDPFRVPSVAADQWGVVALTPTPAVGMLFPPWPDNEQAWLFEVRTHDGATWSAWETLAVCASIRRVFGAYQVRTTMSRRIAPYRPALRGWTAVLTH